MSTILCAAYSTIAFDIDGVIHRGGTPTPGVAATITALREQHKTLRFVTNNASKSPQDVADLLTSLHVQCTATEVVTSVQTCVALMEKELPAHAKVFVIGTAALANAVLEAGFELASPFTPAAAVIQGFNPNMTWQDLAAACWAIQQGSTWYAPNQDRTIPLDWGQGPGNGAMGLPIQAATGRTPKSTGKPHADMYHRATQHAPNQPALFVGDRLDTDAAGARAAGLTAALVLTGVCTPQQAISAEPGARPHVLLATTQGLTEPYPATHHAAGETTVANQVATNHNNTIEVTSTPKTAVERLNAWRAVCHAAWHTFRDEPCPAQALHSSTITLCEAIQHDQETKQPRS